MSNLTLKPMVSNLREIIIKGVASHQKNNTLQNTKELQITSIYHASRTILHNLCATKVLDKRGITLPDEAIQKLLTNKESDSCDSLLFDPSVNKKIESILDQTDDEEYEKDDFLAWVHQYWIDTSVTELLRADKRKEQSYENLMYYEVLLRLDQEQTLFGEYYTPFWVTKYIVDHSFTYYRQNQNCPVEQIKLLDPACGTGNFLIYALDAFLAIYEYEHPDWSIQQIITSILQHNIYGVEIQSDAREIAVLTLWIKVMCRLKVQTDQRNCAKGQVRSYHEESMRCENGKRMELLKILKQNIVVADSLFPYENDSRNNEENEKKTFRFFQQKFDLMIMNPPFVDTRNMSDSMKQFMKTYYPKNARNLVAAFVERSLQLTHDRSVVGFIASDTFKTLVSFKNLRKLLLEHTRIRSMVELGYGVFEADVSCGIYFFDKHVQSTNAFDFMDARTVKKDQTAAEVLTQLEAAEKQAYSILQSNFLSCQDYVFLTDMPRFMAKLYEKKECLGLGTHPIASCRVGLQIGDQEELYTKHVWDVPKPLLDNHTYVKISKSNRGSFLRDYHDVLLWNQTGEWIKSNPGGMVKNANFYFKKGLSYNLGGKIFKVRKLPETVLFTQGSSGIFLNPGYEQLEDYLLGVLKSKAVNYFLLQINPTNNTTPNDVKKIPIVLDQTDRMQTIARITCDIQKSYLHKMQFDSVSEYYKKNALETFWCGEVQKTCERYIKDMERTEQRILQRKRELDEQVYELYHVSEEERQMIEAEFDSEQENPSGMEYDRRKTAFTKEDRKKFVVLDYIRTIAKRIMLQNDRHTYEPMELEQRIRMEITDNFYHNVKMDQHTAETYCDGTLVLNQMEQLLGVRLTRLLEHGIPIATHRFYLSGRGSDDLTEPYLRSKLIVCKGGRKAHVYWHHTQFLTEFDGTAKEIMDQELNRIAGKIQ